MTDTPKFPASATTASQSTGTSSRPRPTSVTPAAVAPAGSGARRTGYVLARITRLPQKRLPELLPWNWSPNAEASRAA
jgi:hypothetical protein